LPLRDLEIEVVPAGDADGAAKKAWRKALMIPGRGPAHSERDLDATGSRFQSLPVNSRPC